MKKGKVLTSVLSSAMILALVGCGSAPASNNSGGSAKPEDSGSKAAAPAASNGQKTNLSLATGTTSGVYYPLGASIAKLWSDKIPNLNVASQASNGSVQNLNFLSKGEANVVFTTVGTLYEAYNGENSFKGRPYKNVRVLGGLYPNADEFVIRKGAANGIADLKGKNFIPGATASATEIDSKRILEAYGLTYKDMKVNFVGFTEAVDLLRNKQADATMIQAGLPTAAVTELTTSGVADLVSLDADKIDALTKKYPWLSDYTIPAKTYEGQDKDIKTVAQPNMLVVDASMSDDMAYQLTKTFYDNLDSLKNAHSVVKYITLEQAVKGLAGVPMHPGAMKYFKEKGILK